MGVIQSEINKLIGQTSVAIGVGKKLYGQSKDKGLTAASKPAKPKTVMSPQEQAAQVAQERLDAELAVKKAQAQGLENMQTSLGRFGDLPENLQKRIQEELKKKNGEHK